MHASGRKYGSNRRQGMQIGAGNEERGNFNEKEPFIVSRGGEGKYMELPTRAEARGQIARLCKPGVTKP